MQVLITGKNLELTEAIKKYAEDKFTSLDKFMPGIIRASVVLSVDNHHNKGDVNYCECKLEISGNDLFISKEEQNMYKAIDKVSDHLAEELKKNKEKQRALEKQARENKRDNKSYQI